MNGDGAPGDDDYWNMLSFTVNAPGTLAEDDSSATLETRTVSVGAYDALFLIEESPEKEEEERQMRIADAVFSNSNQLYWASLVALIIGAVFQREILNEDMTRVQSLWPPSRISAENTEGHSIALRLGSSNNLDR